MTSKKPSERVSVALAGPPTTPAGANTLRRFPDCTEIPVPIRVCGDAGGAPKNSLYVKAGRNSEPVNWACVGAERLISAGWTINGPGVGRLKKPGELTSRNSTPLAFPGKAFPANTIPV